ncbi:MAG: hypothetical protein ACP5F3_00525 [Candidatus Syntrophosphaera sp.]
MKLTSLLPLLLGMLLMLAPLSAQEMAAIENIDICPNPMGKFTVISITFSQPVNVDVSIQTYGGEIVKSLYGGNAGEMLQLAWDRIDDYGNVTPAGKYFLVVNHEGRYTSTKKTIILK